jgi:hypothetical protein
MLPDHQQLLSRAAVPAARIVVEPRIADVEPIDDVVKIENIGFPVREPMLAEGKVDAITGFSFSMYFNLLQVPSPRHAH